MIPPVLILVIIFVLYIISSIKILAEYERGVIFRLGKLLPRPKGPGVILVFSPIDRIVRVSLRTIVFDVPPQDVITRDNVSVKVNAVVYFRVIDPRKAIVEVENYNYATSQLARLARLRPARLKPSLRTARRTTSRYGVLPASGPVVSCRSRFSISIGSGKMIVEFFSDAISVSVCR